jgi:hypothetical protein
VTYDEIKYFEGIIQNFKDIKQFFNNNKVLIQSLGDKTIQIFNDPRDVFVTLERLEDVFDGIDYLKQEQVNEFDELLYGLEKRWDHFAMDSATYIVNFRKSASNTVKFIPGMLIPNTSQILGYIDRNMLGGSDSVIEINPNNEITIVDEKNYDIKKNWSVFKVRMANELVAAHSLSHSSKYRLWSHRALGNVKDIDKHIKKTAKNINEKEMAATLYAVENVNVNNKKLRHSIIEAKLLQTLLGTELYYMSFQKKDQFKQALSTHF